MADIHLYSPQNLVVEIYRPRWTTDWEKANVKVSQYTSYGWLKFLTEKELLWLDLAQTPISTSLATAGTSRRPHSVVRKERLSLHKIHSPCQSPSKNYVPYTPQQQQQKGLMKSKMPVVCATLKRIPHRNGTQCCHNMKDIIIPHLLGATVTVKSWCGGRLPISGVAPCPQGWRLWPPICIWPGPPPRPPLYGMS